MNQDQPGKVPGKLCNAFLLLTFLFVFSLIIGAGVVFWIIDYFKSSGPLAGEVTIVIPEGRSLRSISVQLENNKIIKHARLFSLIVRVSESGNRMKAGEYSFAAGVSPVQVFDKIASGNVVVHNVTIPEGLMVSQILEIIKNTENLEGELPSNVKEGSLLPETYDYNYGDSRKDIIKRMQLFMQKTLDDAWEKRADNLPIKNKDEALVLASIIEKETGVSGERKRIAAVFVNRLLKRMRLQTDPTVIYAITKGRYVLERSLRFKDLEISSSYNTYRNYGLPPFPISNPGKASIEAALNPIKSSELYFVADGTGGHKFSSTLRAHNNNVQKWRRVNRVQKRRKAIAHKKGNQ